MKDIQGYEGLYAITEDGRVWSYRRNIYLRTSLDKQGYPTVKLHRDGKVKFYFIHRLVALAYIPNPENKLEVNHINEIKTDNRIENLEWTTPKENANHGTRNQRIAQSRTGKKVYCVELDKVYNSQSEASKELKVGQAEISKCCSGKRKTAGGYHWQYTEI